MEYSNLTASQGPKKLLVPALKGHAAWLASMLVVIIAAKHTKCGRVLTFWNGHRYMQCDDRRLEGGLALAAGISGVEWDVLRERGDMGVE